MKIAMIGHKRVPGGEGGVEVVVEQLSRRMAQQGHSVTLYNRACRGVQKTKAFEGCRIVTIPTINRKSLDALVYSFLAAVHSLFGKYDVYHFHALGPSVMLLIPHLFGKRTVATVHGLDWQRAKWGGLGTRYLKLGEKVIARYADEVIVLSRPVQEYFLQNYGRQTSLIPNGVEPAVLREPAIITEKFGLTKGSYILFLARIVPEKGLHYLIDSFLSMNTGLKLVIAGGDSHSGGYYEKICGRVQGRENIIMTGFVAGALKEELFSNCAVYVLPSDIEGMPISLLEAMSYGVQCLSSNIEENRQVLGEYGCSFRKGDREDLKNKLEALTVQVPDRNRAQIAYIAENYSWDMTTEKTLKLYR